MEPQEIWELILRADDLVKYAGGTDVRRDKATRWLLQARAQATAIGNAALVEQAQRRLVDLGAIAEDVAGEGD
jgi:hypothetical protein